jgi:hypothetical protein
MTKAKNLNSLPLKIELPELAQTAFSEMQKNGDVKMAYALIVSYFLRENFSVDAHKENAVFDVEKLINAYKNLPEDLETLDVEDKQKAEAIKKTMKNVDGFFAEFNDEYGTVEMPGLTLEEMFEIFRTSNMEQKNNNRNVKIYKHEIFALLNSSITAKQIAETLGCSYSAVRDNRVMAIHIIKEALKLGESTEAISEKNGINLDFVKHVKDSNAFGKI